MTARAKDQDMTPDSRPIAQIQADRLAAISGLDAKELVGSSVLEITEKFRWRIAPELLLFRRICGRVVKKDPVTGVAYPVPFATVHVEDTDCNFLGLFPKEWPWAWYLPISCQREEIATVVTDACGRFCVYVPRWEVDWILRWRRERICFPEIFIKPSIRDLLGDLLPPPPVIRPPIPEPDPPPFLLKDGGMSLARAEQLVGRDVAEELAALEAEGVLGASTVRRRQLLDSAGVPQSLPLPLPTRFIEMAQREAMSLSDALAKGAPAIRLREMMAEQLNVDMRELQELDVRRCIGPFIRCTDIFFPEWLPIWDVPDITFRVTQDVDGDGDEETIYSEGYFDVRWNAGPIPDVTLEASQIAVAGVTCDAPEVPCDDAAAIVMVGLMPLSPAHHDAAAGYAGYALRPNRPHPSGLLSDPPPNPAAKTPYTGTLQLYGCNHRQGAKYYRLRYSFNGAAPVPFTNLTWTLTRLTGGGFEFLNVAPDPDGWYEILDDAAGWLPAHLLLNWPTRQNGLYAVHMELGNAAKNVIDTTTPDVSFVVDNSRPVAQFTELAWRQVGAGNWINLDSDLVCLVVQRPTGADIEFKVSYLGSAVHLRSLELTGGGCGGGNPQRLDWPDWSVPPTPEFDGAGVSQNPYEHWHTDPDLDNSAARTAVFRLPGSRPQGAYSFSLRVISRAFNPAGGDGGFEASWKYDPVYRWAWPRLSVAVVDV